MARNPERTGYTPVNAQDLVTKAYLESIAAGLQSQITALGSGGIPDPGGLTPSYANTDGYGDRSSTISFAASNNLLNNNFNSGGYLVNGTASIAPDSLSASNATPGMFMKFTFSVPVLITEARWYLENSITANKIFGVWQWEGSNNDSTWSAIGSTFTLDKNNVVVIPGGSGPNSGFNALILNTLSGNTLLWKYYRMKLITVNWSTAELYLSEIEFKIARP